MRLANGFSGHMQFSPPAELQQENPTYLSHTNSFTEVLGAIDQGSESG